jgi:predicted metal-dependent phosphoesterase TrpH
MPAKTGESMIIDLHVHTAPASPCSSAPVEDLIEEAKRIGLSGICLTDHNYVWDRMKVEDLARKHAFLVLRGNEIITDQGDMLVFGLDKDVKGIVKLEELRQEVTRAGGVIVVPHPFRGFLAFGVGELGLTPLKRPFFKYVDALEIRNGKVTEKENDFAEKVAIKSGLPAVGGSDAHEVSEVGDYATQFPGTIGNEKDLIEAIKQGNCQAVSFGKEHRRKEI